MQNAKLTINKNPQMGFSLIELMLVIAISGIMFGLVSVNLFHLQNSSSSVSNVETLVSDIKSQQVKAMVGSSEGRSVNDSYGVYFLSDRYIIFHGTAYSSTDSANFTVMLPSDLQIQSTKFPSNTVVFTKLSGEIQGFTNGNNTITVKSNNITKQVVITINRYGVITGVN